MFDALSERLQETLSDVRGRGKLSEDDINKAMRDIRLALLEADVNFKVVKDFTARVKARALGVDVLESLNPGQQVVKIVDDELTALMGESSREIVFAQSAPTVILMAGLQGSGKTTNCGKLALMLKGQGKKVGIAACDVYRPAAIEQLKVVGDQVGAKVYEQGQGDPVKIAKWAVQESIQNLDDVLIVDTAGRLHVDSDLMEELAKIRKEVKPHNVLLVVDAMTGQDAVNVAEQFADTANFDGVIMTKLDGDARGGAALSIKAVTGKPIMYASVGEKLDQFEVFHPDRMADRILGMGDVMTLIEKAESQIDEETALDMERKIRKNELTFDDFLEQMKMMRKMGSLSSILGMMPGIDKKALKNVNIDEKELDRIQAIVLSMTPQERANPKIINGKRRVRIAKGSGTSVQQVNKLIKQFSEMKKMMKRMTGKGKKGMPDMSQLMGQR
ncbi:MAG: signal recognition particle protein [Solirubrobacterales bacterium]|nr:signal recognition particle protein [Solirubrobacterales bacterium]